MKKKYQDILIETTTLIGKIPKVNMSGATATAGAYISAYNDYSEACDLLGIISSLIKNINNYQKTIDKYKGKDGYDIDEMEYQITIFDEQLDKAYKELKEFIHGREAQGW